MSQGDSGVPLSEWSGSGATDRLRVLIEEKAKDIRRHNTILLWMTGAILVLTVVLTVLTFALLFRR